MRRQYVVSKSVLYFDAMCLLGKLLQNEVIGNNCVSISCSDKGNFSFAYYYFCRIWHDNTGNSPSWYFSRMTFLDLQTGSKYYFICEEWLSLDSKDRLVSFIRQH